MSLTVEGLCFNYGDKNVLNEINMDVEKKKMVSILGPNGVGKTTLLKCICRLHKPQFGSIFLEGEDISNFSPRELSKKIGYVPQRSRSSSMTVFDAVMIGRRPHIDWAITEKDIDLVWNVLKLLRLDHLSLKYLDNISGGELQKVQIARALVQDTGLMIFDEPTNNLDIANQHDILHIIRQLVTLKGISAIMTMHDINLALSYSDKYLFIKDRKIIAYGGEEVVTEEILLETYGVKAAIKDHDGRKFVVPEKQQPSFFSLTGENLSFI